MPQTIPEPPKPPSSETPKPPSETPQQRAKGIASLIGAVQGLTITNAVVIAMLVVVAIPAYFVYSALNNEKLLDKFLSSYEELSSQYSTCGFRQARMRGGPMTWGISSGFAYSGNDRYLIAVWIDHKPTTEQMVDYCHALHGLVDYMRDPTGEPPVFPGTDEPIIRHYAPLTNSAN